MRGVGVRARQVTAAAGMVLAVVIGIGTGAARPAHAEAAWYGAAAPAPGPVVDLAATPSGQGYWLVGADGGVFTFGDAGFHGSLGAQPLVAPITAMVPSPTGGGYWLVATDGGVFSFGDATFLGSLGGLPLTRPIVDAIATPSGQGYWLVASDGGVFAFGDATFHGSLGAQPLVAPITAVMSTPGGDGYWLVATDGGVFSFGDAAFRGSLGAQPLVAPIVDGTRAGDGYWLVAGDGGVFTFGGASFFGSAAAYGRLNAPMAAIAAHPRHTGYWTSGLDGGVFGFDESWRPPSLPSGPGAGMGAVGPSNWAALRPQGSLTVNTPGAVIENVDVTGQITINAPGVTIRNFRANNIVNSGYASVFEDGEIHGNQNQSADGLTGANYTARRLNIHGVLDGLKAGSNTTIEGSWIHDLVFINQGGGNWTHNDGIQVMSGSNIVIRNNVFEGNRGNAAIFLKPDLGPIDNVLIEGNIIGGGGYTLYSINCCGNGAPSNVTIRNNVFTEEHLFGYAVANPGPGWQWANNTNQAGQPINPGGW